MLSSARLAARVQPALHLRQATTAYQYREYRGDPGPSTAAGRNDYRANAARNVANADRRVSAKQDRVKSGAGFGLDRRSNVPSNPSYPRRASNTRDGGRPSPPTPYRSGPSAGPSRPGPRGAGFGMQQNRPSGKYASSARPAPFYNQIPNYERPTGHMGDPFETSKRVAEWIAKHPSPIKPWDIDELLRMVMDAPRYRMNTVVWNQVISLLGKEHKLEVMFRALNHVSVRALKVGRAAEQELIEDEKAEL